ncbi:hypothetical protein [Plantactinospora sp. KLBMP9567]|uniref:hypothetical protein n=1 Tax=Plantactinospora sp. KLBMP9567 TaxID=3085900 RepID=UPI002981B96E|nr:hypothetical protein [Plantactinospora sp. KLBMP9567]MDW5330738.1 hypothetical protein [Plantactinospora sp. KLBMP9567]
MGLATATSLQTSIRHADTKAATLLATEGAVATAVTEPAASLLSAGTTVSVAGTVLLVGLLTGLSVASWHLIRAMRPQLDGVAGDNRFGFPNLARAGRRPTAANVRQQRNEAWEFVSTLALIAMGKHTRVRKSLPWLVMSLTAAGLVIVMRLALSVAS